MKILRTIRKKIKIYRSRKKLGFFGKDAYIGKLEREIIGSESISIGNHVFIEYGARLAAYTSFKGQKLPKARIVIGDNTSINQFFTCLSADDLIIGSHCLIASFVFITNFNHSYVDPDHLYINNPLDARPTHIGNNVWIGEKAVILPGVTIGSNSIIGAGSIVTKDIPDYCMAAGNPAKVIKMYDQKSKRWNNV